MSGRATTVAVVLVLDPPHCGMLALVPEPPDVLPPDVVPPFEPPDVLVPPEPPELPVPPDVLEPCVAVEPVPVPDPAVSAPGVPAAVCVGAAVAPPVPELPACAAAVGAGRTLRRGRRRRHCCCTPSGRRRRARRSWRRTGGCGRCVRTWLVPCGCEWVAMCCRCTPSDFGRRGVLRCPDLGRGSVPAASTSGEFGMLERPYGPDLRERPFPGTLSGTRQKEERWRTRSSRHCCGNSRTGRD